MLGVMVSVVGIMLLSWYSAITQPKEIALRNAVAGQSAATNFWAYRSAVATYQYNNPGFTGTIPDASVTFPMGYVRNLAWTNTVQSGVLYTYSNTTLNSTTVDAIASRGGRTMMIGIAASGNTMTSVSGAASGFSIPSSIPVGAVVVIGN